MTQFILALTLCLACMVEPVSAQTMCGPYDAIKSALEKNVQEVVTSLGVTEDGSLLQIFSSPTGTWTVVVTKPNGLSCFVASGDGWQVLATVKGRGA